MRNGFKKRRSLCEQKSILHYNRKLKVRYMGEKES